MKLRDWTSAQVLDKYFLALGANLNGAFPQEHIVSEGEVLISDNIIVSIQRRANRCPRSEALFYSTLFGESMTYEQLKGRERFEQFGDDYGKGIVIASNIHSTVEPVLYTKLAGVPIARATRNVKNSNGDTVLLAGALYGTNTIVKKVPKKNGFQLLLPETIEVFPVGYFHRSIPEKMSEEGVTQDIATRLQELMSYARQFAQENEVPKGKFLDLPYEPHTVKKAV
ncbi:hypothetical protein BVX95_02295 [archaeon D22]|nr:hypothetical protein BVX95_02295 [archaeon D22]